MAGDEHLSISMQLKCNFISCRRDEMEWKAGIE